MLLTAARKRRAPYTCTVVVFYMIFSTTVYTVYRESMATVYTECTCKQLNLTHTRATATGLDYLLNEEI